MRNRDSQIGKAATMNRVYLSREEVEALFWVRDNPGAKVVEYPDSMILTELVQKGVAVFGRSADGFTNVTLTEIGVRTYEDAYRAYGPGKGVQGK
jgi:hypothetical protein